MAAAGMAPPGPARRLTDGRDGPGRSSRATGLSKSKRYWKKLPRKRSAALRHVATARGCARSRIRDKGDMRWQAARLPGYGMQTARPAQKRLVRQGNVTDLPFADPGFS